MHRLSKCYSIRKKGQSSHLTNGPCRMVEIINIRNGAFHKPILGNKLNILWENVVSDLYIFEHQKKTFMSVVSVLWHFTQRSKVNHFEFWSFAKCKFLPYSCFSPVLNCGDHVKTLKTKNRRCLSSIWARFISLIEFFSSWLLWLSFGNFRAIIFILNYKFRLSVTRYFWFCKCVPPWMFPPQDILFEYWFEHVTSGLVLSFLGFLLGYSTGEFQALHLIVTVVFGAVD